MIMLFSVLYTHQKAKKAKTWQDGVLRVSETKAVLCDEECKTLESLFIQKDQVAPGEEIESDRYLITIEERLGQPPPDHTQGVHVDSHTIQRNEFIGPGCINQPGKRKRQCFQPPILSHSRPALTQPIQPEAKKKKEDNIIPQQNVRLAAVKSSSSKHDFFNLYKAYSGKQERETNSPCYQNESSLQAQDVHAPHCFWPTGQQQDQRVPFSITAPSSVAEKENQRPSNQVFTESRRSTAQILALFSSSKNTPRLQNMDVKESTGAFHSSISDSGRFHMHRLQRHGSMDEELKDTVKFSSCVNSLARATYVAQPNFRENDSNESKLTVSGDVCESVNVSPDSLTACSSQTTCTLFDDDRGPQGNHAPSRAEAQEPAGGNEKQNKLWLQTGSETVPPVMRHPVGGDRDHPQVGVDLVEERCWPSDGVTQDGSKLDHCKSESLDSAHFNETPSVTQSCHNLCLTRSLQGFQASTVTCSDADLVQASPLAEPNLTFRRPHTDSLCIKDVFTGYKYIPETRHGKSVVSSHPGSLFPYSALDRQNQTMALEGLSKLKPWNRPYFDSKCAQDVDDSLLQSRLSPELYAPEKDKLTQRRAAAVGTTKVIPSDSRTVKAGDGHLWTGSVVSDTVKRESPSLPMVSVLRSQLHNQPRHVFSGDESDPLEGFATSESIALSSTEGFINQNKVAEQTRFHIHTGFVQRVPQLATRRTPILTAPFETRDDISTETCFTVCHETAAAASVTEVSGVYAGSSGLCDGGKEKHSEQSLLRGSCGRIGLRRVGLGSSRNLPKKQNVLAQVGQQVCQKSYGYKLPTLPDRSMAGELSFPTAEECDSNVTPTRHVTVPVTFENVTQYRQVFKAALREHLNIVLFELARAYYTALNKVDVSWFGTHEQGSHQRSDGPSCPHGQARLRAVKKEGPNKGRLFFSCPGTGQAQCKFFKWADEYQTNKAGLRDTGHISTNKLALSSAESVMDFLRSHNVAFYCECHLMKKHTDSSKRRTFSAKAKKWGGQSSGGVWDKKKGLYLELPRKDHSSAYSKDDIWIISKNLSFNKESTFIASSTYYGPSSSGELEILPISGYSPSNWQSGETVHALMACNAGTELSCINNIEEHVKMQNMPVLPHILHRVQTLEALNTSRTSSFVPPVLRASCCQLDLPSEVTDGLAEEMIARFNLNKDQAAALHSCARMFISSVDQDSTSLPVCLIHGAFGAGKSYLLAVIVLYLVELFRVSESLNHQSNAPTEKKILVSSTTNVAVDRILLGLLELGFEEFVRVGSIRKIAKPVLPYSVHSTGSDSQELKELQALLKGELTPSERTHVRKSIERHKLGKNKKKLSHVRVVGVTCAACVFPYLDKLKFSVLLLDECSQMTEPASLLPMARFECQKLVLVGDPKQLSPTIQGSEPEHEAGLEQTLFDRLMKMGYEATLLRTQYRCHPAISALSNRLFYDNKLLDGVAAEDRSPVVDLVPTLCFYNVATGKEKRASDGSYYNEAEAKFVVFLIECLLESGVEPAQMGVITLYKSQLHTVANNLTASRASSHSELKTIQISTVDAFQGGEKDIIILSCVRTDHIGFIDCDRRTNVALTRAKRHLLIVGHLKMLSCNSLWGRVIEHCRGSPDGLCNSQEFIKKWQQQESTALNEAAVPVQVTEQAKQTSDAKDQHTSEILPDLSATTCSEETERQVAHSSKSGFSSDTMDINCSHGDYDSDIELPTFDLVSSLGI